MQADTLYGKTGGKGTQTVPLVSRNIGVKPICADFMYIGISVCIYRFNIYNVVMEREKPKERQQT